MKIENDFKIAERGKQFLMSEWEKLKKGYFESTKCAKVLKINC